MGHAIEARLYAEDPADGFRPSGGVVHAFAIPGTDCAFWPPPGARFRLARDGPGEDAGGRAAPFLRLDSGVEPGTSVSAHYDAMLAKVIAWSPERDGAARRLAAALAAARIAGPATNRDLLVGVLRDPAFLDGGADTSLLDDYDFSGLLPAERICRISAAAAAAAVAAANRRDARAAAALPGGWRNVVSQPQLTSFTGPRGLIDVRYYWTRAGITIAAVATERAAGAADDGGDDDPSMTVGGLAPDGVTLDVAGVRYRFDITRAGAEIWVDSPLGSVRLTLLDRLPAPERAEESGSLVAPMPGSVTRIAAAPGDRVLAGQLVLVLEAMKMEHQIAAPASGVLAELRVGQGAQVNAGDVLAIVTADEATNETGSDDARR